MTSKTLKRLVIDASVAQAAGGQTAAHPTSKQCRDFLTAVLEICHRVVMTPEISEEWRQHQSSFARGWRVSMEARKKVTRPDPVPSYHQLYARAESTVLSFKDREAMYKDFCLLEAALHTDRIVVSLDDTVRHLFAGASRAVAELRQIAWVNPDKEAESVLTWLEEGAGFEEKHCLGFETESL
jgi:hypothetical protein